MITVCFRRGLRNRSATIRQIEFALSKQCLDRRIGSLTQIDRELTAWQNEWEVGVKWRFTTADARVKLHSLYPSNQE